MSAAGSAGSRRTLTDPVLADLVEQLTARLQNGEEIDLEAVAAAHPDRAEELGRLLPALRILGDLRSSAISGSQSRKSPLWQPAVVEGVLGDYRIIREIGRGGMGVVYEAQQISLRRRVALKVLPFAAMLDPRQLQRFQNEAQAAACLHHRNIVPVYAVGCERGVHYYAMQYIEGQSLDGLIRQFRQDDRQAEGPATSSEHGAVASPAEATPALAALSTKRSNRDSSRFRTVAQLGLQAAEALDYAHQQGIVHRDVKPANLLVDMHGTLWITDFGLARCQGESGLTHTGDLLGTLRYMSPEQARGNPGLVDLRTDVYGLGATLYELLTLQPAFTAKDRQRLLQQITSDEPCLPRRLNKSLPVELETIVLKTLAKAPHERYTSAQELADDLRRFLDDKPIRARRPNLIEKAQRWTRRHHGLIAAGIVVLLTALAALWIGNTRLARQRDVSEQRRRQAREAVDVMYTQVAQEWLAHQPHLELKQKEFLVKALEFYKEFANQVTSNPELRLEAARAGHRVADIEHKLGRLDEAQTAYRQVVPVLRQMAADDSASGTPAAEEFARCLNDWGNLCRDSEQLVEAEQAYQEALPILAKLAKEETQNCALWDALAGCTMNHGLTLEALGRREEAKTSFTHALTILTKLAADDKDNAGYQHDLASCQCNLAALLRNAGRLAEAKQYYEKSLTAWLELTRQYPVRPVYRQALAAAYQGYGTLLLIQTRSPDAEKNYHTALNIQRKLVEDFPSIPVYQQALAVGQNRLASLMRSTGRTAEARGLYGGTIMRLEALVVRYPRVAAFRRELAATLNATGEIAQSTGQLEDAEKTYRKALVLAQELTAANANVPENTWLVAAINKNLEATTTARKETDRKRK
jgi:serine/threonine protein kinase